MKHSDVINVNLSKANDQLGRIQGDHPTEVVRAHMDVAVVYMLGALVAAVRELTEEITKSRGTDRA